MRSVWPVGMAWGRWGRQTSSSLTLNGRADRVNEVTYDYLGNATTIKQTGNITDEIFAEFDYNANGLLTAINRYEEDENDVLTAVANSLYEYNANNAVTSITHKNPDETQIVKHSYTYDSTNNIVEYLNSIDGNTEYNYDFLGQLIGADHASQSDESYTYDSNGNRLTANGDTYTTGTNNELTSDDTYTYTYDAEGNRISKTNSAGTERELYTWDYRNRLTSVTKQTYDTLTNEWSTVQIVEYTYDHNNIWIRKTIGDSKTIFIPENYQTAVQIDNNTVSHHYLWTPNQQDKLLADTTTTGVSWSLTDHLGTIRDILSATGTTHLIYDAFGNLISGTNPILFGFTGKAFDTDTNLQNNINRWYDATIGRWLSTDPIGFEGDDTNLYRYVNNKILLYCDNKGLSWFDYVPIASTITNVMFPSPGQDVFDYFDNITLIPTKQDCCGNSKKIDSTCEKKIIVKAFQFMGLTMGPMAVADALEIFNAWSLLQLIAENPNIVYGNALRGLSGYLVIDALINTGMSIHKMGDMLQTAAAAIEKFCRCP